MDVIASTSDVVQTFSERQVDDFIHQPIPYITVV